MNCRYNEKSSHCQLTSSDFKRAQEISDELATHVGRLSLNEELLALFSSSIAAHSLNELSSFRSPFKSVGVTKRNSNRNTGRMSRMEAVWRDWERSLANDMRLCYTESVSAHHIMQSRNDHRETVMIPGNMAFPLHREEERWGAETSSLKLHGTKELNAAGRRVAVARLRVAVANEKRLKNKMTLLSAPPLSPTTTPGPTTPGATFSGTTISGPHEQKGSINPCVA